MSASVSAIRLSGVPSGGNAPFSVRRKSHAARSNRSPSPSASNWRRTTCFSAAICSGVHATFAKKRRKYSSAASKKRGRHFRRNTSPSAYVAASRFVPKRFSSRSNPSRFSPPSPRKHRCSSRLLMPCVSSVSYSGPPFKYSPNSRPCRWRCGQHKSVMPFCRTCS